MKKVIYNQYGDFQQLEMVETETPEAKKNQLLIKVQAVAINPLDWKLLAGDLKIATGRKFPKGMAYDFSGVVANVGKNISNYKKGDGVFGAFNNPNRTALAEYIIASEKNIQKIPPGLSFEKAAALTSTGISAIEILKKAQLKTGENVLINGAAGGVGYFLTQLAVEKGLKVTAVATGTGLEAVKKVGVTSVLDYKKRNVLNQDVAYDAVLDLSGTISYFEAKKIMKAKACFVNTLPLPKSLLWYLSSLFSRKKYAVILVSPNAKKIEEILKRVNNLKIAVTIFDFYDYKLAYETAKKGGIVGKVVIVFS